MKLSMIVPCYNEATTIKSTVESVMQLCSDGLQVEVIVVDDCSSDGSDLVIEELANAHAEVISLRHDVNRGKGAALRSGFYKATGDYVGIQAADNEYDPHDYLNLLRVAVKGGADVVYGSRYLRQTERMVLRFWHTTMNRFLTLLSNMFSDVELTDMETCYKLIRADVVKKLTPRLRENRFGFEPEITALIAKGVHHDGWRLAECAISYAPRTFSEGKKIGWLDGVRAIWCIVKYNLFV